MPEGHLHQQRKTKNFTVLAIIFGVCVLIWAVTLIKIDRANASETGDLAEAVAGRIKDVGRVAPYELSTRSPVGGTDVYTRQLEYRVHAIKLRQQIQERSLHYAQPSAYLLKQYKANLQAQHETISEENVPSYFATWNFD